MPVRLDTKSKSFPADFAALLSATRETEADVDAAVATILDAVKTRGDAAVIEYGAPWGRPVAKPVKAWGEKGDADTAAIRARLEARFGKARAERIAYQNRNMLIFPNLVINDIMAVTVRTFFPVAPGQQNVSAWALAPKEENEAMRERRLYNYLEFLGPGGFATPDDCEALALCQAIIVGCDHHLVAGAAGQIFVPAGRLDASEPTGPAGVLEHQRGIVYQGVVDRRYYSRDRAGHGAHLTLGTAECRYRQALVHRLADRGQANSIDCADLI